MRSTLSQEWVPRRSCTPQPAIDQSITVPVTYVLKLRVGPAVNVCPIGSLLSHEVREVLWIIALEHDLVSDKLLFLFPLLWQQIHQLLLIKVKL